MRPCAFAITLTLTGLVATGVAFVSAAPTVAAQAATPRWHMTATVAESCSCTVACPCNFGGSPNHTPCQGNRLISITKGNYGDVDLSGVSFLITFEMRGWSKVYVSDKVSDAQNAAVEALLPIAFVGFRSGMLSYEKAPMTIELTESRVRFSTPESAVEMEVMRGLNGKPVQILNLPSPTYQNYTQFKSVTHQHTGDGHAFSHSGTNGFTSTWEAGSK